MNLVETIIPGVWVIESTAFQDNRGAFSRLFCSRDLQAIVGPRTIVQINHSKTHGVGAVRGLHFQNPPYSEMKIVRCLKGRVFDVAVDLRQGSPTFLKWTAVELTPENRFAFVIPEGCAHGFQVLEEDSELLYLHTAFYTPDAEGAVRFDDPRIDVNWPLAPTDLSARDLSHPHLKEDFKGIVL
ncbi:MAG: dTDP-4-dehydrorhamnose 3,5-epimerase [Hydrogenophilales bacterium 17-64-65]|nr:MAG: dTDP-4-dehydrorhamnose 3,5-epimerase [Hydrogenophilales bacterium 16-64-40]OZA34480.1 MAG: dTDP-4-dehydrorhamnose 3,5-epimerase [Hydrogenophilales bacterium 17-64-65]HQT31339.1 dTDP-4-dehydrorhamnose 3,5-epimerase [Thiobacillus sp.]